MWCSNKKAQKGPKKKYYSSSQPIWVIDKIRTQEWSYHVAGEPMISQEKHIMLPGDMKSLHAGF
jgi:hypothetical protein